MTEFKKGLMKSAAALAILTVAGTAALLVLLRIQHNTEISLPVPTGPSNVGRTVYHWVDYARMDSLAPTQGEKRELMVWIWYPSDDVKSASAVYIPAAWRAALAQYQGMLTSAFLTRDLSLVHCHSFTAVKVSAEEPAYPVVIMRPCIGALAVYYSTLAEDLASHGYIVVGIDAPYSASVVAFPDGHAAHKTPAGDPSETFSVEEKARRLNQLMAVWSADTRFVLDRLEQLNAGDPSSRFNGRLDLQSVGIFGHSFGGAAAAQFCHEDARCKAGIDMDGAPYGSVIREGLNQPFMFILSNDGGITDSGSRRFLGDIQSFYARLPEGRVCIAIRGSRHANFNDEVLLKNLRLSRLFGETGPINPRRCLQVTAAYICAFFDRHLKNAPSTLLEGPSLRYPEVQFVFR